MSDCIHLLQVFADDVFEEDFPKRKASLSLQAENKGQLAQLTTGCCIHTHNIGYMPSQDNPTPTLQKDKDEKSAKCIQCKSVKGITKSNSKVEIQL